MGRLQKRLAILPSSQFIFQPDDSLATIFSAGLDFLLAVVLLAAAAWEQAPWLAAWERVPSLAAAAWEQAPWLVESV